MSTFFNYNENQNNQTFGSCLKFAWKLAKSIFPNLCGFLESLSRNFLNKLFTFMVGKFKFSAKEIDFTPFVGNGTKVKIHSQIKPPLISIKHLVFSVHAKNLIRILIWFWYFFFSNFLIHFKVQTF